MSGLTSTELEMQKLVNTPRTREACARTGIDPKDLRVKNFQDFYIPGDSVDLQRLRFNHNEAKRQERLHRVLAERSRVLQEGDSNNGSCVYQQNCDLTMTMVEELMANEARKLDRDLRNQARYHATVENENRTQIERELQLRRRIEYRNERAAASKRMQEAKGLQVKQATSMKLNNNACRKERIKGDMVLRRADSAAHLLAEDARLKQFNALISQQSLDRNEKWQAKRAEFLTKASTIEMKKAKARNELFERHQSRLYSIDKRKEALQSQRSLRNQSEHFKLIDAKLRRQELERCDRHRRDKLGQRINEVEERIDTMLTTKEQVMRQRRELLIQQESSKGKPINIRNILPGPADYSHFANCVKELPAPKISDSKSKSLEPGTFDFEIAKTLDVPAPGTYDPQRLPNGQSLRDAATVAISKSSKKTYLDKVQQNVKGLPGPGSYELASSTCLLHHGPRIVRDYVSDEKSSWLRVMEDSPGPAAYSVDTFHRQARRSRGNKFMPLLARALSMSAAIK